jgi:hypothetical protein
LAPAENEGAEDALIDDWCIIHAHDNEAEEQDEDNINEGEKPPEEDEEDNDNNENEEPGFPLDNELATDIANNNTHDTDGISDDHGNDHDNDHDNGGEDEAYNKDKYLLEDEYNDATTEDQEQLETTHTHGLRPKGAWVQVPF